MPVSAITELPIFYEIIEYPTREGEPIQPMGVDFNFRRTENPFTLILRPMTLTEARLIIDEAFEEIHRDFLEATAGEGKYNNHSQYTFLVVLNIYFLIKSYLPMLYYTSIKIISQNEEECRDGKVAKMKITRS